jgi:hypothetical protein
MRVAMRSGLLFGLSALVALGSAQSARDEVAELRDLVKSGYSRNPERYVTLAHSGTSEARLFALANIDKVIGAYSYFPDLNDQILASFRRELGSRKSEVERKLILRAGIRIIRTIGKLPGFTFEFVCGTGLNFGLLDGMVPILQSYEKDLLSLMGEDCHQACDIAGMIHAKNKDGAVAGLRPWLKSKVEEERKAAAATLCLLARNEEDGKVLRPFLEKLELEEAQFACLRLGNRLKQVYPVFREMPRPIRDYICLQPEELDRHYSDLLSIAKELSPTYAYRFFVNSSTSFTRALPAYRAVESQLGTMSEFKGPEIKMSMAIQYIPLFDAMLESPNPLVRTWAGKTAMTAASLEKLMVEPLTSRYVSKLLADPNAGVRYTTRSVLPFVSGAMEREIRRVLAADGVSLPPP